MTDVSEPPGGIERRRERLELAQAMEDVRELQGSVTTLAQAVTKIIPEQVGVGVDTIKALLVRFAVMLGVFFVALMVANQLFVARIIGQGHEDRDRTIGIVTCFQQKASAGDASDAALLACTERSK